MQADTSKRYARHPLLRQHAAESVAKSGSGAILVSAAAVNDLFADLDAIAEGAEADRADAYKAGWIDAATWANRLDLIAPTSARPLTTATPTQHWPVR